MNKQTISFRGSLADDIVKKIAHSAKGAALGEALQSYLRKHADDLACVVDDGIIIIAKRNESMILFQ
jgi:hypothetical protein